MAARLACASADPTVLELPAEYGGRFQSFEVLAAAMRYIILRGRTYWEGRYMEFAIWDSTLCLPDLCLGQTPFREMFWAWFRARVGELDKAGG